MFSFGFGYDRVINYLGTFDPLDIDGLQLYLNKSLGVDSAVEGELVSEWLDQSPSSFTFSQITVTKQPVLGANSINFDAVDDILSVTVADALNDTSGIIFFSYYWDGVSVLFPFSSADSAAANRYAEISINSSGDVRFIYRDGVTPDRIAMTDSSVVGYNYGWIRSDGSVYTMSLNGSGQVLIVDSGASNGNWFGDLTGRDDLSVGGLMDSSPSYGKDMANKLIYSNATLTTEKITEIDNFMSDPNN